MIANLAKTVYEVECLVNHFLNATCVKPLWLYAGDILKVLSF